MWCGVGWGGGRAADYVANGHPCEHARGGARGHLRVRAGAVVSGATEPGGWRPAPVPVHGCMGVGCIVQACWHGGAPRPVHGHPRQGAWHTAHGGAWCMVHGARCMVHGAWCMVHGAWCMVHGAWCMVHGAWCVEHCNMQASSPCMRTSSCAPSAAQQHVVCGRWGVVHGGNVVHVVHGDHHPCTMHGDHHHACAPRPARPSVAPPPADPAPAPSTAPATKGSGPRRRRCPT